MTCRVFRIGAYVGALSAALILAAASTATLAHAQPPSKLQGVFNTVRRMPLKSPLAPHVAAGDGMVPSALSQASGSWAPMVSHNTSQPAQTYSVRPVMGRTSSSPHNLPEPSRDDPVFPSEPDGGTEDMLPFYNDSTPNDPA